MKFLLVPFFAAFLALPGQNPANPQSTFENANKAYEGGRYAEAVTAYDQLVRNGTASAAVYFNRGNACFKLGQLGHAIESYRLAQRLDPRDRDLRANLQLVRTRARGGLAFQTARWQTLLGTLSLNEWTCLTAAALWIMFLLLAFGQWRPERAFTLRKHIFASGIAAAFFGTCLCLQLNADYLSETAIVIAGEAEVRNGPLDESPSLYKVRDGIELKIIDRLNGWLQVMDSANRIGWLRKDQVLLFNGPAEKTKS